MRIVAELGINTNGSLDTALQMVEAAAEAGVDGIKVQAYDASDFLPEGHRDWDMFTDNRLSWLSIERVQDETLALGLDFGATPTSIEGVQRLAEMKVDWLKNGSDFLLRRDLIEAMLDTGIETWASTGMASPDEIENTPNGANLMLCTSLYPCPDENAHIGRLRTEIFKGLSDHTLGSTAAVMAAAYEMEMWEGHFTLDHDLPGPDHHFSRSPAEMAALVTEVRRAELLLGEYVYPDPAELVNRDKWRVTEGTLRP